MIKHILPMLSVMLLSSCIEPVTCLDEKRLAEAQQEMSYFHRDLEPEVSFSLEEAIDMALDRNLELIVNAQQELFQQQLLSGLELKESEANLASAEAEVALAEKSIEGTEIRAGYRGKIANVSIRLFEIPERDKPMLAYLNDESIIAKFLIPSTLLKLIHIGEILNTLIMETEEIIPARIMRIGPDVNPTSGTVKIEAEFANPDGRWKCGMTSFASFDLKSLLAQNPLAVVLTEPEHERVHPEQKLEEK